MPHASNSTAELVDFANTLADTARGIVKQYFRQPFTIDAKGDESPVTVADREIEQCLREMLGQRFSEHGILGEEFGAEGLDRHYVWVLDPIDGTRSFITGTPTFGTLISLLKDGTPLLGVVDMPAQNERWVGGRELATQFNGEHCTVSACKTVEQCRLVSTAQEMFSAPQLDAFKRVQSKTTFYRYGGDCYNYALLASGFVDLVIEADLKPYDYCALVPVVENAGGVISDWQGRPLTLDSAGDVAAAATPALHVEALALLNNQA